MNTARVLIVLFSIPFMAIGGLTFVVVNAFTSGFRCTMNWMSKD